MKAIVTSALLLALSAPLSAKVSTKRPDPQQLLESAQSAIANYQPSQALKFLSDYDTEMRRRRASADERVESMRHTAQRMDEMMQRVEQIVVIDSITVDSSDFFKAFHLDPSAGVLCDAKATLPQGFEAADLSVVYLPEKETTMIWGSPTGLMQSSCFTDGTWNSPTPLGDQLNCGGVANYPFLMADGVTLYYATKGDDSLGGYDLYVSRRDDSGFLSPQNMGMPYNSPANDYMLAIDEVSGLGWWASDRTGIPGKVTIYVFIPAEMRTNVDVDSPNLAALASLSNISLTWPDEQTLATYRKRLLLDESTPGASRGEYDFEFTFPNGQIYHYWSDFRSGDAQQAMERYVDALESFNADSEALEQMRADYTKNKSLSSKILAAENKLENNRLTLKKLANRVIKAEFPNTK
jgi:hypothetical protein